VQYALSILLAHEAGACEGQTVRSGAEIPERKSSILCRCVRRIRLPVVVWDQKDKGTFERLIRSHSHNGALNGTLWKRRLQEKRRHEEPHHRALPAGMAF